MNMDVYNCEECGKAFAVESGSDLNVCPICESELWEFSHEAVLVPKEIDLPHCNVKRP